MSRGTPAIADPAQSADARAAGDKRSARGNARLPRDPARDREHHLSRLKRLEVRLRGDALTLRPEERRLQRWRELAVRVLEGRAQALGLSHDELGSWVKQSLLTQFPARHRIFSPGDTPAFLSVVVSGHVKTVIPPGIHDPGGGEKARDRRITVQFARPGYVVDLAPTGRFSTGSKFGAVAHTDSIVLAFGRDAMCEVLDRTSPEGQALILVQHLRTLSRMIYEKCLLLTADVRTRLVQALVHLARTSPHDRSPGTVGFRLRHLDLAELVGACRFTVTRALRQLVDAGSVTIRAGWYTVSPHLLGAEPPRRRPQPTSRGHPTNESPRKGFLQSLGWMSRLGVRADVIRLLVEEAEIRAYDAGSVIGIDDTLFAAILASGVARIEVEAAPDAYLGVWYAKPGQFIGAGWAGPHEAQVFRAVAHDDCEVAFVRPDLFMKMVRVLSGSQFLNYLGYIHEVLLRQLYDRCVMLPMRTTDRLLYQAHVLATDFPESHEDGTAIALRLRPRRDLASLIAADPWVFGRAFVELKQAGRIRILPGGRILVVGYFVSRTAA